ncbi:peptidylprolyl isomerase [Corallococcus exiguus]|uniref:peptidylprolyl isomerase n=1 Tax=Corallococcus exiguus TaxID=83462 RepID=UPI003211C320
MPSPFSNWRHSVSSTQSWSLRALALTIVAGLGLWFGITRTEAHSSSPESLETESIAVVDDEEVSLERFNRLWQAHASRLRMGDGHISESMANKQKSALAERLIEELLVEHAAEQELISVGEKDVETLVAQWRQSASGNVSSPVQQDSNDDVRRRARIALLVNQLVERRVPAAFSDEDILTFFERNPFYFQRSDYLDVEDLLIVVAPEAAETELLAQKDETIALREQYLATVSIKGMGSGLQLSAAGASLPGSRLVRLTASHVPGDVWERLNDLSLREVSPVLHTEQGFHVYRLMARGPSSTPSFAAVSKRIPAMMRARLLELRRNGLIRELRSTALVQNNLAKRLSVRSGASFDVDVNAVRLNVPQSVLDGMHE